jgi:hypothetical protein
MLILGFYEVGKESEVFADYDWFEYVANNNET